MSVRPGFHNMPAYKAHVEKIKNASNSCVKNIFKLQTAALFASLTNVGHLLYDIEKWDKLPEYDRQPLIRLISTVLGFPCSIDIVDCEEVSYYSTHESKMKKSPFTAAVLRATSVLNPSRAEMLRLHMVDGLSLKVGGEYVNLGFSDIDNQYIRSL